MEHTEWIVLDLNFESECRNTISDHNRPPFEPGGFFCGAPPEKAGAAACAAAFGVVMKRRELFMKREQNQLKIGVEQV